MLKKGRLLIYAYCSFSSLFFKVYAGEITPDTIRYPLTHHLSANIGFDYVASSVDDDIREKIPAGDKINVHTALPLHVKYSFSFTNPAVRNYLPGGYQGIGVAILNFGCLEKAGIKKSNNNIGYPMLVYVFQGGPFRYLSDVVSLDYEWNFGASLGWKPYSQQNKYFNLTVGSRVNAYLNLNIGVSWKISERLNLFGGFSLSHFSNGNTSFPNPGVNSLGLRAGITYDFNPLIKSETEIPTDTVKSKKVDYDISLWGASRKRVYRGGEEPVLLKGYFACAGISFAPMVRLNTWWKIGGSLDLQWDQSSNLKNNYIAGSTTEDLQFKTPSIWSQTTVGLSAHGELCMPIFSVNIGCGYNLKAPWENRGSYQNITLKTYICKYVYINVGYQLRNFYQQSSLMLGIGLTI